MANCVKCSQLDMRHSIVIQSPNPTTDAGGGRGDPWATPIVFATVRASIVPFGGREILHSMQLQDSVTHKVTMRYKAGVIAKMRIKFGTRIFNIRRVINVEERNRFYEILAEEGVAT